MSAAEGQVVTAMTMTTLKSLCNSASFGRYWRKATATTSNLEINEPTLPHCQMAPHQIDEGSTRTFHETVVDYYRVVYFEALDLTISCIKSRVDQPGYKTYGKVQTLLLKAAASETYDEELEYVLSFYCSDFNSLLLPTYLEIFCQAIKSNERIFIRDVFEFLKNCTNSQCEVMSQVSKLVQLLFVMPATNAQNERSFSTVRRIKMYLCATMS